MDASWLVGGFPVLRLDWTSSLPKIDGWVDGMQQVGLQLRQHMFKLRPKIGAGGREEGGREVEGGLPREEESWTVCERTTSAAALTLPQIIHPQSIFLIIFTKVLFKSGKEFSAMLKINFNF